MNVHATARTLPHRRMPIVQRLAAGRSVARTAAAAGVTAKTVRTWRGRHVAEGGPGFVDQSSRPHHGPARLATAAGTWPYTQLLPSERQDDAAALLDSSLAWLAQHGVIVERVMTDDGSAFKSRLFAAALEHHGTAHRQTRPSTSTTDAKAERFIQSSIREGAHAAPFTSSAGRQAAMHPWLHADNAARPRSALARPHSALGGKPPISRLTRDDLPGSDS